MFKFVLSNKFLIIIGVGKLSGIAAMGGVLVATDRRKDKPSGLNRYHDFIAGWIEEYKELSHRPTLKALYELIRDYHHFSGSYEALRRYVRKHFAEFVKKGARIRIETPPGVLM